MSAEAAAQNGVVLTIPSRTRYLYTVRGLLYPLAIAAGYTKKAARLMVLAVDEACANIMKHAYQGAQDKTITVTVRDEQDRFVVMLRDYGIKADRTTIVPRDLDDVRPGGLGTHFMASAFESIVYDTSNEQGTLLILEKKKQQVGT